MSAADADSAAPRFAISTGKGKNSSHATKLVNVDRVGGYVRGLAAMLQEKKPEVEGWWSVHQWQGNHRGTDRWIASVGVAVDVDFFGPLDATGKETHVELPQDVFAKLTVAIEMMPGNVSHFTPRGLRLIFVFPAPVTDKDLVGAAMAGACDLVHAAIKRSKLAARVKKNGKREIGLAVDGGASCDFARLFYDPGAFVGGVQRLAVVRVMSDEPTDPVTLAETPGREDWAEDRQEEERETTPPKETKKETNFERAAEAWNRAHPGDWPKDSGTCPICGHNGCFGWAAPDDATRWRCFSSNHDGGGRQSPDGATWVGDALDVEAHVQRSSRRGVLIADGYLIDWASIKLRPFDDVPPGEPPPVNGPEEDADPAPRTFPTLRERVLALGKVHAKIETKTHAIQKATRGGLRAGLSVFGGAPGTGKTTYLVDEAADMAARGIPVAVLAADEDPDGLTVRLGQGAGYDRDKLESGDVEAVAAFAEEIPEPSSLLMLDGESVTIEEAARLLAELAAGRPSVLIVDSIQTARADGTNGVEPRQRVDAVVKALKAVARGGVVVIATSELSRGAYRSKKAADNIEPLSAFKESGGVEYAAHLAIVMRNGEEPWTVDAEVVKNRWGAKPKFRLKLDPDRATFEEVALPDEPEKKSSDVGAEVRADMIRVRNAIMENPGKITGEPSLLACLNGVTRARARVAYQALKERGEIKIEGSGKYTTWTIAGTGSQGDDES